VLTHDTQQRALTLGWLGLVLMLGAGFTPDASAQQDPLEGLTIDRVEIRGLESLGEGYVRRILRTRAGEEFSREDVETDIRELLRTRKFVNVFAEPTQEADRVVVAFVLREKPALNAVIVSGNSELSDSDIYDVLPAPGAPIDRYEIDRARDEVLRLYQEDGYYYATVTLDENALERRGELILNITEGPRVRVRKSRTKARPRSPSSSLIPASVRRPTSRSFRRGPWTKSRSNATRSRLPSFTAAKVTSTCRSIISSILMKSIARMSSCVS
jgi:outer membrane protein assembly factor BamA